MRHVWKRKLAVALAAVMMLGVPGTTVFPVNAEGDISVSDGDLDMAEPEKDTQETENLSGDGEGTAGAPEAASGKEEGIPLAGKDVSGNDGEQDAESIFDGGIVVNGGFEDGLDGWDNWSKSEKFQITEDAEYVKEGSKALFVESTAQDWVGLTQNVLVEKNTEYEFSFWGKNTKMFCYKIMDSSWSSNLVEQYPTGNGDWQEYTGSFNSGDNETVIFYLSDATANGYYDNVSVKKTEKEVPSDVTGVVNGDFSDGLNGWDTAAAGGKFTVSEGRLHINSSTAEGCYIEQQVPVVKGTYYTVTVESEGAAVRYQVLDAEKQAVLADEKTEYFCVGNRSAVTLRMMDTEGNAAVEKVAIAEAVIKPANGRGPVNAAGTNKKVELVDADAVDSVRSLFVYLQEVGSGNLLFGHQTDNSEGIVKKDGITSDTYHTVGAYPAFTGFEMASMARNQDRYVQLVQEAYKNHSIPTICDHMPNFTGGGGYSDMTPTYEHIMPGGKDQEKFLERLDQTAEFARKCVDENGNLIPIIYRPFHENSGMWFWWGVSNTTKEQFINLWRFTVEYLRDVKGVHNLLYAYSPNGHFSSEDNYLDRYPGDDYVDIIGFDIYFDRPSYESKWMEQTLRDAQIAASIASKKGKVAAITEAGIRYDSSNGLAVEGNAVKDWFTQVHKMLMGDETAKQIAYLVTWRNQDKTHFWVPYDDGEGDRHEMANDFTAFYNDEHAVFADRTGNFADIKGIETIPHEKSVYFVAPTTGEKMKRTVDILLKTNATDVTKVTLSVGEHNYEAEQKDFYYVVSLDTTGCADGNYVLKAVVTLKDGTTLETTKTVKIWNDENTSDVDVRIFDDFDGYFGETENLNQAYNRNTNGDVNEISLIDSPFGSEYGKAMQFKYSVATGGPGYSGTAKTLNYDISGLDSKGISFWYQGDGKGADILLQINMPNCFEAHLNDLEAFDKDSTEPQFVEISWEEFKPKGHTSQKDLSNIQTYAVYVNGTGIEDSTLIFDEICVMTARNGDFSDDLNGWDTAAAGGKFTVSDGRLLINSSAAEGCYIERRIPVVKGTYYTVTVESEGAAARYQVLDGETKSVLADERDKYFCVGNCSEVILRMMDTEGNAIVSRVAMEEALIKPDNGRDPVNAAGTNKKVELVDADAVDSVRSLFVYLQEVGKDNLLFGHQADNTQAIVKKDGIASDTYHTVGAYPAFTGFDMAMGANAESVKEAYKNHSIATLCDHMRNFSGGSYSDMTPTYEHIMPGGKDQEKFLARLDQTAALAKACVDENGEPIPIIYRPFHENSGMWFWWGVSNTTKDQFINLWRFTVEYLRDVKGVHNLLYAYSPNGHFSSEDDYLSRYPGDDYVDVIGFDIYFDNPSYESKWMEQTLKDSQIAASIASKKGKVAAITEAGIRYDGTNGLAVEGNAVKDWFTQVHNMLMGDDIAKEIAYLVTWRNQDKTHFWVPYDDGEGDRHEMANDFTAFYNYDNAVFADRMGNFADIKGIETIPHEKSVYFVAPTTGEKMKGTVDILLRTNAADVEKVTLSVGEHNYEAVLRDSDSYYVVSLDTTGCVDGDYVLKAVVTLKDGTTLETTKTVKIWNDENTSDVDVRIFDDFDGYFGETENLNQAYNRNTNGDVNEISLIDSPFGSEHGKAMKFKYSVTTGGPGYSGTAKTLNYDISGLDSKGISFWYQGDGKGADILLQINMPNCFEAHLNDLKSFDKDSTEPQFIEISWEEFKPKGHNSQKDLSNIQTYAVYVNGTGIEDSTLIFDEIRVMTDKSGEAGNVVTKDEGGYLADADAVKDAVLTEEDKVLMQEGTDIEIIFDVQEPDVPDAGDKVLIEKALNGKKVACYLNIELYKKIGDREAEPIHETKGKIGLVIPVPEEMIQDGREFSVIYVHNGTVKALADTDTVADTVTVYADEFSTYALVYSDKEESPAPSGSPEPGESPAPSGSPEPGESTAPSGSPEPGESTAPSGSPEPSESPAPTQNPAPTDNGGGNENAQESTNNRAADSPKTGDSSIIWWAILALAAGSILIEVTKRYYANKEKEHMD